MYHEGEGSSYFLVEKTALIPGRKETKDGRWKRMKKKFWYVLVFAVVLVMGAATGSKVLAKEKTRTDVTQIQLYLGQQISLADIPKGSILLSRENVITISENGMAKAVGKGTVRISVDTEKGIVPYADVQVKENEMLAGLSFNQQSFAGRILGAGSFTLDIPQFRSLTCVWSSENTAVAAVTREGVITPAAPGWVNLKVVVTDQYGGEYSFVIPVHILEPKFSLQKTNLAKGCQMTLTLVDSSGNPVVYQSYDTSVVSLVSFDASRVTVKAKKVGKTTITGAVDGVQFQCEITVTDPAVKTKYGFYQKKKSLKVSVTGLNAASKPVYTTSDSSVAAVTKTGRVRTLKYGSAVISCRVDGKTLSYYLAVSTKKAVKAMRWGYKQVGKKKYSQARRMSKKYFDCSSFVYRSYRAAGKYLVCRTSWAPVAADIARYYVRKGKQIKASGTYNLKKLRPGDLICFGGSKARKNGRYKRIYHIAIYIGNGKTLESSSTYNNVVIRDRGSFKKSSVPVVVRP